MIDWWNSLTLVMKILWGVTLTASLIFVVQSVLTFIGADTDGLDSDFDDPSGTDGADTGANLYTFRNFVNFCLGFGWTAILLQDTFKSPFLLLLVSILIGIGLVTLVMYMFKLLSNMQQSGTINVEKMAVGCNGKVYLTIPGERAGEGKVQITINSCVREYTALTDGETLPTGTPITVSEVLDPSTLIVERQNSLII